jgi:mannose-6-phosphate isomerase-like protein (cupin superfamily)
MPLTIRRVVTGHDATGRASVKIDEIATNATSGRPGQQGLVLWTTGTMPADNTDESDAARRKVKTSHDDGTVFRIVQFDPGVAPRNHRTDSIDYAIVMSGEIDMVLDGTVVHLKAGDALVQRGTIHDWVNRGTVPCVIAFALIAAKPVTIGGKTLHATG